MDTPSKLIVGGLALVTTVSVALVIYSTVIVGDYPIDRSHIEEETEELEAEMVSDQTEQIPQENENSSTTEISF